MLGALTLGASLMYFLDPDRGRRRRAVVRDRATHLMTRGREALEVGSRDLGNRVRGRVAQAKGRFRRGPVDDGVLAERVRARLGGIVGHAGAIEVAVETGEVTLRGSILAQDVSRVIRRVRGVPGVRSIDNQLEVHSEPDAVPGLQGAARAPRGGEVIELWQHSWAPGPRLAAGLAGGLLALGGMTSRGLSGKAATIAGMALVTRAALNVPFFGGRAQRGRRPTAAA
jgi:hypothetical protein